MEIELQGEYLNSETAHAGDLVEMMDEGTKAQIKKGNELKEVYNFRVMCGNKELIYTPGIKALKQFVAAWGKDSAKWKGKKWQVKLVNIEVAGKEMCVIRPIILEQKI